MTYTMATNFNCEPELAELGEAFPEIAAAEEAYNELRRRLERVQRCASQMADTSATRFLVRLNEARHDSSWGEIVGDAEETFSEARAVTVARRIIANEGMSQRLDADALKVGSAAE